MKPKVSISLVTFNGERYLADCLASIFNQTFKDFELIVIDNYSKDQTRNLLRNHGIKFWELGKNLGFAKGHNLGIGHARGDYVLILNQDVVLKSNFLEILVKTLDNNPTIAAASGKIYRAGQNQILDSTGLLFSKNRQITDRGADQPDQGQYDQPQEIFGLSGAVVLFRRLALETVKIGADYFDTDYFCYKEDVDLAWRLQLAKFGAYYQPEAVAHHHRGSGPTSSTIVGNWKSWRNKSGWLIYHSYKNHWYTLIKNEHYQNFFKDLLPIIWHELKKFAALVVLKPGQLLVLTELLKNLPRLIEKRKLLMAKSKISALEFRKIWISRSSS